MANNSTNSRFANTGPPQTKKSGGPGPPGPPGSDAYGCNTKQYKMNTDELTVGSRVGISCTCSGWLSTDAAISSLYTAQFKHRYNYQTALCFHAWLTDRQTDRQRKLIYKVSVSNCWSQGWLHKGYRVQNTLTVINTNICLIMLHQSHYSKTLFK